MVRPHDCNVRWQAGFLELLPEIQRRVETKLFSVALSERDEARQAILVFAMIAYASLAARGRTALAYPGPLVAYGLQQYQAGRLTGGRMNSLDVGSTRWRRVTGRLTETLGKLGETVAIRDLRSATPAEQAALRLDFAAWLQTLTDRDRRAVNDLARGEETRAVARRLGVTAGRVSQLRRELHRSWMKFRNELAPLAA
ncbi:MAG: hypothetical protein CMJ58_07890 [Planctomycetaceae bacterium]|nr:hypothetical protein [Planctomycetaceae bacterium]